MLLTTKPINNLIFMAAAQDIEALNSRISQFLRVCEYKRDDPLFYLVAEELLLSYGPISADTLLEYFALQKVDIYTKIRLIDVFAYKMKEMEFFHIKDIIDDIDFVYACSVSNLAIKAQQMFQTELDISYTAPREDEFTQENDDFNKSNYQNFEEEEKAEELAPNK